MLTFKNEKLTENNELICNFYQFFNFNWKRSILDPVRHLSTYPTLITVYQ